VAKPIPTQLDFLPRQIGGDHIYVINTIVTKAVLLSTDELRFEQPFQVCQCWTTEEWLIRHTSEKWYAPGLHHCFGHVFFCFIILFGYDLVDNDTSYANSKVMAQDSVQLQFIECTAYRIRGGIEFKPAEKFKAKDSARQGKLTYPNLHWQLTATGKPNKVPHGTFYAAKIC
jgi:hypothetical protein